MGPVGAYSAATYPQPSCFVWQQLPALQTSRARNESQPEYVLSDISPHPLVGRPRSHPFLPESEHSGPLERGKCDKSLCFRLLHPPERDVRFQTVSPPSASSASPRRRIRSSLGSLPRLVALLAPSSTNDVGPSTGQEERRDGA